MQPDANIENLCNGKKKSEKFSFWYRSRSRRRVAREKFVQFCMMGSAAFSLSLTRSMGWMRECKHTDISENVFPKLYWGSLWLCWLWERKCDDGSTLPNGRVENFMQNVGFSSSCSDVGEKRDRGENSSQQVFTQLFSHQLLFDFDSSRLSLIFGALLDNLGEKKREAVEINFHLDWSENPAQKEFLCSCASWVILAVREF